MKATDQLRELFTQMAYDSLEIADQYADEQGLPTGTIDEYLNR